MATDIKKTLVVVTGATASGKTALSINLASRLGCDIISADSRQIYKGIPVITAQPTPAELAAAKHHNIGRLPLEAYYSASQFEAEALALLGKLFGRGDYAVVCGGSMMYVDALTHGIDDIPTISPAVRARVAEIMHAQGGEALCAMLQQLDPGYYASVDRKNIKRVAHAVEICLESGQPYSTLRTGAAKTRPFRTVKLALDWPREELFARINSRVEQMALHGMEDEARSVYHLRHLNALNTVGFKEMFRYIDGIWDFDTACARMAKNTRVYAKKQLTWLRRDPQVHWLEPHSPTLTDDALSLITGSSQ